MCRKSWTCCEWAQHLQHTGDINLVSANKYSKIPLIQYPQDQKDARLSNILHSVLSNCVYVYWPNFWQVVLGYYSYIWAAQIITVFHLDRSFNCWFMGIKEPFYVFWISSVPTWDSEGLPGDCGSSLHSWSWWGRSQGARKCHYGQCGDTLRGLFGALPDLEVFPQLLKDQDFKNISFWIKETLLYTEKYTGLIICKWRCWSRKNAVTTKHMFMSCHQNARWNQNRQPAHYLKMW